ncbi:MAG: oxidoreductase [Candidatus Hodarchaeales archaeon]|jgi:NAD(P)-dependent dehydrogenase (short-subunit alcohol dehydrogenase family)
MTKTKKWKEDNIPDLKGKIAIVTGANSGTGFSTTRALAQKGAHVVMGCRSKEKGQDAIDKLKSLDLNISVELILLDLANLSSVKQFAESFKKKYDKLDFLFNNAGVMMTPYLRTKDDFEIQIGTNHLGHFALTGQLIEPLRNTDGSRVINMSSNGHKMGKIDLDNLNWDPPKSYQSSLAYAQSKLANLLFTYELDRKLRAANSNIISVASHPGWSETKLQSTGLKLGGGIKPRIMRFVLFLGNKLVAQSADMGALPMLMGAVSEVEGGDYFGPRRFKENRGHPKKVKSSDRSHDKEVAQKLWEISEELTGVSYNL